ncbi:MAG: hypothetical protein Q9225_001502 [Loekoesia sp. 1 TL-2023]
MAKTEGDPAVDSSTDSSSENREGAVSSHAAKYAAVAVLTNVFAGVMFAGGMLGFSLSRLSDLDYDHTFKDGFALVPGYWYYFHDGHFRVGMIMHLAAVLPAGILMVLQFTPVIRQKWITFHRVNGYTVLLLPLISNAAASAVLPHKQGGGARTAMQTAEAFLVLITTLGMAMAWWNIRRKQIDQHRAWMLRTMFYLGTIITSRIINFISSPIISRIDNFYGVWSCDELDFLYKNLGMPVPQAEYPQCLLPDGSLDRGFLVAVEATHLLTRPEQYGTIHIIGVKIYLAMTPRESERLRRVSYEKQLEAGFASPGSAGLTSDRWGDADKWTPPK